MWQDGKYYRHIRTPAGPRREYVGTGLIAKYIADDDDLQRQLRQLQIAQRRQERAQERHIDAVVDDEYRSLRMAAHAVLLACGWHQHKREWRRTVKALENQAMDMKELKEIARRYNAAADREAATKAGAIVPAERTPAAAPDIDELAADLDALVKRCNTPTPKRTDLDALRKVVAFGVGIGSSLRQEEIRTDIIRSTSADTTPATLAVVKGELDRLAADLGAPASPMERALIDHIATCWLRLSLAERALTAATSGSHNPVSGVYREKRLSEAQRRYLRALGLLAKLRSLAPANLQVNVAMPGGAQQVNNFEETQ